MYTKVPAGLTCSEKILFIFILGTGKIATWIIGRQYNLASDNSEEKVHDTYICDSKGVSRQNAESNR